MYFIDCFCRVSVCYALICFKGLCTNLWFQKNMEDLYCFKYFERQCKWFWYKPLVFGIYYSILEVSSIQCIYKQYTSFLTTAGGFSPNMEDPLPGQMKKQLVLKIISGQQLPKPKDSMLGDRGEVGQTHIVLIGWNIVIYYHCMCYS